jgi:pescadillo protein
MGAKKKPHNKKNRRGYKKGDKIHGQKKGKKGEAAAYMTRAQALAKLQVSLADFRRLCILKGIYPRDPKKKPAGMDKTYYHSKDILFLTHEPLLNKFFELKTFMKKFKRLMGRKEYNLATSLEDRKPKYTLHHLVRERFSTFDAAVRDLDDAVSMLALFQALSADQKRDIPAEAVAEASRLYQEFQLYVIRAQALRKVFASIKGYYFQAEICGQPVTWLAPHQFAQELPPEVDFRVMLTFLEFYRAMVKFVNFKLYSDLGLEYPPKRHEAKDAASAEIAALEAEMREAGKAREEAEAQAEKDDAAVAEAVAEDFGQQTEEAAEMQKQLAAAKRMRTTFRGLKVFINREVPLRPTYFTLLCGGAEEVGWERGASAGGKAAPGSAFSAANEKITHHVIDRPAEHIETREGREYVQPQWVFDCFNVGCLIPVAPYAPGRSLPPHLSPFVDDKAEGYVPRQREILDQLASEAGVGAAQPAGEEGGAGASGATPKASGFDRFRKELLAEAKGVWHSDYQEGAAAEEPAAAPTAEIPAATEGAPAEGAEEVDLTPMPKPTEDEEERLRAKALMPKKHKRLLQRIEKGEKKKNDLHDSLMRKRNKLEASGARA